MKHLASEWPKSPDSVYDTTLNKYSVHGCMLEIRILLCDLGNVAIGSFVRVVSVVFAYHNLNPIMSLDNAVDSSINTRTTEEDVISSKMNLHAAGREPSLVVIWDVVEIMVESLSAFWMTVEQSDWTSFATVSLLTMPRAILAETPLSGPTSVSNLVLASLTISWSS